MSLKLSNLATDKQKAILEMLEYIAAGKYTIDQLSVSEAAKIIDGLFEEKRLERQSEEDDVRSMMDNSDYPF